MGSEVVVDGLPAVNTNFRGTAGQFDRWEHICRCRFPQAYRDFALKASGGGFATEVYFQLDKWHAEPVDKFLSLLGPGSCEDAWQGIRHMFFESLFGLGDDWAMRLIPFARMAPPERY